MTKRQWIKITDQNPTDQQDVWYYFGVFDRVYKGKYTINQDSWTDEDNAEHTFQMDCFYGNGGFLNGDVMFWMPCNEGDTTPERPDDVMLLEDIHIPDRLQVEIDAMTIERMYQAVHKLGSDELFQQIQQIIKNPRLPDYYYRSGDD